MNIGKYVPTVATLIVAVVVLAGVAFPMIGGLSSETTTISNDGASWIRMAYITDQSDYSVEYTFGDNVSVAGQSGEWEDMILYADSQCTVCIVGDNIVLIVGDVAYVSNDPQTMTVSRSSGIVSIDGDPISESTVSWAYVPVANGKYGSFGADTVPLHRDASNVAAVGGFAGVYAYNENVSMDLGLVMDANVTEEYINSVRWALESDIPVEETQPFHPIDPGMFDPGILNPGTDDPAVIDDPIDPSTLDPQYIDPDIGGNVLMSVPTPTYTDGDWGYELSGSDATIVSYSGAGGNITIPATVGGYTVVGIGKGGNGETVFDNSTIADTTITISDGIKRINAYAFYNCTKITGQIVFPSSITHLRSYCFAGCTGITGTISISSGVVVAESSLFAGCTGITGVVYDASAAQQFASQMFMGCTGIISLTIGDHPTEIQSQMFSGCTGISGTVTIPSHINKVGNNAFYGCTSLEKIVYHSNANVPQSFCMGCTSLKEVVIDGNVQSFSGIQAFSGCTALETVSLPNTITTFQTTIFENCTSLKTINIPTSTTTLGTSMFKNCTSLTGKIVIPSTVTSIPSTCFIGAGNNLEVVLSEGVTTIGAQAFQGAGLSQTLVLPSTLTTISSNAFNTISSEYLIVLSDSTYSGSIFYGSNIKEVLNLGSAEWTTTSYSLNAEEVRTDIEATSYMAPVSISETTTREGPTFDLLAILPIVFVAGLVLTTAWLFIRK